MHHFIVAPGLFLPIVEIKQIESRFPRVVILLDAEDWAEFAALQPHENDSHVTVASDSRGDPTSLSGSPTFYHASSL